MLLAAIIILPFLALGLTGAYRYKAEGGSVAPFLVLLGVGIFLLIQAAHGAANALNNFEGIVEQVNSSR